MGAAVARRMASPKYNCIHIHIYLYSIYSSTNKKMRGGIGAFNGCVGASAVGAAAEDLGHLWAVGLAEVVVVSWWEAIS